VQSKTQLKPYTTSVLGGESWPMQHKESLIDANSMDINKRAVSSTELQFRVMELEEFSPQSTGKDLISISWALPAVWQYYSETAWLLVGPGNGCFSEWEYAYLANPCVPASIGPILWHSMLVNARNQRESVSWWRTSKGKGERRLGRKKGSFLFHSYPIVEGTQLQSKKDKMSTQ